MTEPFLRVAVDEDGIACSSRSILRIGLVSVSMVTSGFCGHLCPRSHRSPSGARHQPRSSAAGTGP